MRTAGMTVSIDDARPDQGVMSAANDAGPLPAAAPGVHYLVREAAGKWEVVFGDSGACFVYAARAVAVRAARGAARRHWQRRGLRSVVSLEIAGEVRTMTEYGSAPAPR